MCMISNKHCKYLANYNYLGTNYLPEYLDGKYENYIVLLIYVFSCNFGHLRI